MKKQRTIKIDITWSSNYTKLDEEEQAELDYMLDKRIFQMIYDSDTSASFKQVWPGKTMIRRITAVVLITYKEK